MRHVITRCVAIAAAGALLSGCFALRGFAWRDPSIVAGDVAVADLTLRPGATNGTTDIPFVLVGLPEGASSGTTSYRLRPSTFDRDGDFGGPITMVGDPALRDFAVTLGTCTDHGLDAALMSGFVWRLRRTPDPVADEGRVNDAAMTRIPIGSADDTAPGTAEFAFFSGRWADDGDGVPESDGTEVSCTGAIMTSLPVLARPE